MIKLKSLLLLVLLSISVWSLNLDNTVWNTNWNVMYFWQDGNTVNGEYMYDGGILTGTLSGDTLRGWWREYNNSQICGPGNVWSGPLLFKFSAEENSFTGSWAYCGTDSSTLNPNGTGWTGTIKVNTTSYTQEECENAGRYWCDNECRLASCDQEITEETCAQAGRFWCTDTCKIVSCDITSITNPVSRHPLPMLKASRINSSSGSYYDIRGKRMNRKIRGIIIHKDESGKSRTTVKVSP